MSNEDFKFSIGLIVQYANGVSGQHWVGRIVGREWYENACGGGEWYYVRWVKPSGEPENDPSRIHASELESHG